MFSITYAHVIDGLVLSSRNGTVTLVNIDSSQ